MKTIQTILPVYDRLEKQDYRRTRNALPVHCPRHRLPAMQWNVETDNPGDVIDVDLVNVDTGAITAIEGYFHTTGAYIQGGGGGNWASGTYDVFASVGKNITDCHKTTAAGTAYIQDVIPSTAEIDLNLHIGDMFRIKATLTLNSGTAPKIALQNYVSSAIVSNIVTLSAGVNYVWLKATANIAAGTAWGYYIYNGDTELVDFTCLFDESERTVMIRPYNALADDYFEYKGETLGTLLPYGVYYLKFTTSAGYVYYSEVFAVTDIYPNLATGWTNSGFDTFITNGTIITSAINAAGVVGTYSTPYFSLIKGESIHVIFYMTLNSGELPSVRIYSVSGGTASTVVNSVIGLNDITLTSTMTLADLRIFLRNSSATNFSTSEVLVIRQYSATHIKLTFDNTKDLGDILYQDGFSQTLWLPTQLAPPQHEQVDIGEEKSGIFIAEKIVNKFKFRILANMGRELYRAMVRIPLHDDIDIIDEVGNTYSPAVGNIWINALNWPGFDYVQVEILFNDNSEIFWVSNNANFT